jgi:putative ABC transport system permease protein
MVRFALRTVFAHKLRLILTALSIVMGVAFIAGTFIFTDTIDETFRDLFENSYAGQDVIVQTATEFNAGGTGGAPLEEDVLDIVRSVPEVAVAEGSVGGFALIYDKEGEAIVPFGPPTIGGSWTEDERLLGNVVLRDGRRPEGPDEVTIDARTVEDNGFVVGDVVTIQTATGVDEYTLVGVVGFGESDNLAGATFAAFTLDTAQQVLGLEGQYSTITVVAVEGVTPLELATQIGAALPDGIEAIQAADAAAEQEETLQEALGFIRTGLLVFAFVAIFVAAFIIQNTFRIIVRQRQRELALLRAVGATGRQVIWLVLIEAFIVALVASILGIFLGLVLSGMLTAMMSAIGWDLPSTTAPLAPRTVIVGLVVGIGITMIAAVLPAVRASRIPPVAALQDTDVQLRMSDRARSVAGLVLLVVGVGLIVAGLFGDVIDLGPLNELSAVGLGALGVFLAVAVLSSFLVKPAARLLGNRWVLAVLAFVAGLVLVFLGLGLAAFSPILLVIGILPIGLGVFALYLAVTAVFDRFTPNLATENSVRKPRRTATTAAALMIGLALVGFFFIFGDSIKASAGSAIEEGLRADYVLSVTGFVGGFSPELADDLEELPEVETVTRLRLGFFDNEGTDDIVIAVDTANVEETIFLDVREGSLAALGEGGIFVHVDRAEGDGLMVGDTIPMGFNATGLQQVEIVGTYGEINVVQSTYVAGLDFHEENFAGFGTDLDFVLAVATAEGVSAEAARAAIEGAAEAFPNVTVRDQIEYRESQEAQVDQILVIFNGLLILAVIIALFGITNTLALSVFERTREIGLLRAVGMTRRQVQRTVFWEAIMVAVIGAVLGILVGLFFGVVVTAALASQGIDELSIPFATIIALVIAGAIVGLIAAIFPAIRASRLNILESIAYE